MSNDESSIIRLPPLLNSKMAGKEKGLWFLDVGQIGVNGGFGGSYDWSEDFDDEDGTFIIDSFAKPVFDNEQMRERRATYTGFMAATEFSKGFAHITFERRATWHENELRYDVISPRILATNKARENMMNMETAGVYAACGLQFLHDFEYLVEKFASNNHDWFIQPRFFSTTPGTSLVDMAIYEVLSVAIGHYHDNDFPFPKHFKGFEEPSEGG